MVISVEINYNFSICFFTQELWFLVWQARERRVPATLTLPTEGGD